MTLATEQNLRIGLPSKGRLCDVATELLLQAGLNFRRQSRGLFARVSGLPVDLIFLRTDDIPTLCAEGAIDMGITGSDLVEESCEPTQVRMKLGVGRCRLAFCVPDDAPIAVLDKNGYNWIEGESIHWAGSIEFDPFNPKRVFVTSGNGIFMTDNLSPGKRFSWKFTVKDLEETVPEDLVSIPGGPLITVIGDYDG